MSLKGKKVIVTGGSRGLGLGLVEALVDQGATVTVVARGAQALKAVADRLGVATVAADIIDKAAAYRIVRDIRPDVLVLNAGAAPPMGPIDELSWEDFSANWETDVKGALFWLQAALNSPLDPGSRVIVGSSGAAESGSQMTGGYASSKRALWFMTKYANLFAKDKGLGIRFQAIVPRAMSLGTGVGGQAAEAYAAAMGMTPEAFVSRFGSPMSPQIFGDRVISVLEDPRFAEAMVLGFNGDQDVTVIDM